MTKPTPNIPKPQNLWAGSGCSLSSYFALSPSALPYAALHSSTLPYAPLRYPTLPYATLRCSTLLPRAAASRFIVGPMSHNLGPTAVQAVITGHPGQNCINAGGFGGLHYTASTNKYIPCHDRLALSKSC